jgi:hypothetical protein
MGYLADLAATEETQEDAGKKKILSELATTYSDDLEFLKKVNRLTFGLMSGN